MPAPINVQLFESEITTSWLDEEGILHSISKSPTRTVENVKANIEVVRQITGGKKCCLLVHISNSGIPDKQTRDYVAPELPNVYNAMAVVSKSNLGTFIMNLLFNLKSSPIPMKTFGNEEDAKKWLRQYL